jgi:hypothetical protein
VQRHEPLRTTYELLDEQLVQVVVPPPSPFTLAEVDLTSLPGEERAGEVERLVAAASSRPFDLVVGPLFELILVRLADDDHVVVIRIHHSVFDDWSVGPFRRELSVLYAAFLAGEDPPLRNPPRRSLTLPGPSERPSPAERQARSSTGGLATSAPPPSPSSCPSLTPTLRRVGPRRPPTR